MLLKISEFESIIENKPVCLKLISQEVKKQHKEFIHRFITLSKYYKWRWQDKKIKKKDVISEISSSIYKIIEKEIQYKIQNERWKEYDFIVSFVSVGRLVIIPIEHSRINDEDWIEISISTTL
jgi:hypothetical protein